VQVNVPQLDNFSGFLALICMFSAILLIEGNKMQF